MRRLIVMAALVLALSAPARAADLQPWKTMRALQSLEDRIATGDALALAARAKAIARLATTFGAMPPDTWRDPRNARALVAYMFGGGDVTAINRSISVEMLNKDYGNLFRGALAYGLGDDEMARTLLLPLEAKSLSAGLAGHVALVQASLIEPTDKARAMGLLDLARLIEPGTLVEEAALRKEISIAGKLGDFEKLTFLERRYQAAFARSVYAESFRQLVAELATKIAAVNTVAGNERLNRLLGPLGREERRRLYLAAARRETLSGHVVSASFAATEALKLTEKDSRDEARARVYFGASALVGDGYDKAQQALAGVVADRLDERDRNLHLAALDMAGTIRAVSHAASDETNPTASAALTRGQTALEEADRALKEVRP